MEIERVSPEVANRVRNNLLRAAIAVTILGLLHHIDHVIRGNHIGWPFTNAVTPFSGSLLVYAVLLPGIYLTATRKVGPRYWLWGAPPILLLVVGVHLIPLPRYESPSDIMTPYSHPLEYAATPASIYRRHFFTEVYPPYSSPIFSALAFGIMLALVVALVILVVTAARGRAQIRFATT